MTEVLIKIQSDKLLQEILTFLRSKGIEEPVVLNEMAEDEALAQMMDDSDRTKVVSLEKLFSLRD